MFYRMWAKMAERANKHPLDMVDARLKRLAGILANVIVIGTAVCGAVSWAMTPLNSKLDNLEQSTCRSELLTLMANYPEDKRAIEELAYHYFAELKGDSYVYGVYIQWAEQHNVDYKNITDLHNLNK